MERNERSKEVIIVTKEERGSNMIDRQRNEESFGTIGTCRNSLLLIRKYYHNNKVGVVFAKHTRMVVLFVEVDEHENMSVVAHDISCAYVITHTCSTIAMQPSRQREPSRQQILKP